jgi:hypothetical protein
MALLEVGDEGKNGLTLLVETPTARQLAVSVV